MSKAPTIELIEHDGFSDVYQDVTDPDDCLEIETALVEIRRNPYGVSTQLKAKWEGLRYHIRGKYQIVFAICPECIDDGFVDKLDCADCELLHGKGQCDPGSIIKLFQLEDVNPKRRAG